MKLPTSGSVEALAADGREREMALALDPAKIPAHIAIIMDGNGRWAKRRGLPRFAGHKAGVNRVRSVVEDCSRLGVGVLTLYAFSAENWKRPAPKSTCSGVCSDSTCVTNWKICSATTSGSSR